MSVPVASARPPKIKISGDSPLKRVVRRYPQVFSRFFELFRRTGFDIVKGSNAEASLLNKLGFTVVVDIGANVGQYAESVRILCGYRGRIISFEPTMTAFQELAMRSERDPLWHVERLAFGNIDGDLAMNVSKLTALNSALDRTEFLKQNPGSEVVGVEQVPVRRLDSVLSTFCDPDRDKIFLKIDTQGYESTILDGAEQSLKKIHALQLELSFIPLYVGETLIAEMTERVCAMGFTLVRLDPFQIADGQLLQADATFLRL
jgi:FkbM family methyltransferase